MFRFTSALVLFFGSGAVGQVALYHAEGNYGDASGNGHAATVNGTVNFRAGAPGFGQGFDLDNVVNTAATNYLTVPGLSGANASILSGAGLTVAAWFREDNFANNGSLINLRGSGNDSGFLLEPAYGLPGFFLIGVFTAGGLQQITVPGFAVGGLHHVAIVFDPANQLLSAYRNGQFVTSVPISSTQLMRLDGDETLMIGRNVITSTGFDGLIDEVRLYNRPLSASEILALASGPPTCCAGDFNGNNVVTNADIPDFVTALLAGGACPTPPACCPGNLNGDGMVDGEDIPGFVAKLLSGGACS